MASFQIAVFTELAEQLMVDDSLETFMIFCLVSNPRIFIPAQTVPNPQIFNWRRSTKPIMRTAGHWWSWNISHYFACYHMGSRKSAFHQSNIIWLWRHGKNNNSPSTFEWHIKLVNNLKRPSILKASQAFVRLTKTM